jgi:hypothetical protein
MSWSFRQSKQVPEYSKTKATADSYAKSFKPNPSF